MKPKYARSIGIFVLIALSGLTHLDCSANRSSSYFKPLEQPIQTLNPRLTRNRVDFMVTRAIMGQLLSFDDLGNIQPGIFESWKISGEGKTYTFTIDPDSRFHDGKPVTAEDIAFSIGFLARKDSLVSRYFKNIEGYQEFIAGSTISPSGIKPLDQQTIQISLSERSHIFLAQLADPKIVVIPDKFRGKTENDFFAHPIGAGPFRLSKISAEKDHVILDRVTWPTTSMGNVRTFELKVQTRDEAKRLFKLGKIHDLEAFEITRIEANKLTDGAVLHATSSYSINLLILNGRKSIFRDSKIRRIITESIDPTSLPALCGPSLLPSDSIIPHGILGWSKHTPKKTVVSSRATKSGIGSRPIRPLKILSYGRKPRQCIADLILAGIRSTGLFEPQFVHLNEQQAVKTFLDGDYELLLENLSVRGPEPFNIFTYFDPESPHNLTYFNDPVITTKLKDIEGMIGGQRGLAYSDLSRYITSEKNYAIPLFTDLLLHAFRKGVRAPGSPATLHGSTPFERIEL